MKRLSVIGLFAFALSLALVVTPVLSVYASTTPTAVGVHVGEKFLYLTVSESPQWSSISIITITSIFTQTASTYNQYNCYYPIGDTILSATMTTINNDGTTTSTSGTADITSGGNYGLMWFFVFPANVKAGPYEWNGISLNVQTKGVWGRVMDYTTITIQASPTVTWTIYLEWLQSTGVVTYDNYNAPGLLVGTITLLWQW